MTIDLTGRRALVTGGNVGIGAGIAKRLGACGAAVAITYYSHADEAKQTLHQMRGQGRRAEMFQLDATDSGRVEAVAAAAGLFSDWAAERLIGFMFRQRRRKSASVRVIEDDSVIQRCLAAEYSDHPP